MLVLVVEAKERVDVCAEERNHLQARAAAPIARVQILGSAEKSNEESLRLIGAVPGVVQAVQQRDDADLGNAAADELEELVDYGRREQPFATAVLARDAEAKAKGAQVEALESRQELGGRFLRSTLSPP